MSDVRENCPPVFVAMPSKELMIRLIIRSTQKKLKEDLDKFNKKESN